MAYLGRKGASAALTSADIPNGSISAVKVAADVATQAEIDLKANLASPTLVTPTIASMANCTFPTGHVIQTIQQTKHDESSASYTSTSWDKVKDGSGNAEWKGTINNVGASNKVLVHMSFVEYQYNTDASDGGSWGIYREDARIYGHDNKHASFFGDTGDNLNWYQTVNLHWLDESPATGTNNYYLAQVKNGSGGMQVRSSSTEMEFICILQEIQS